MSRDKFMEFRGPMCDYRGRARASRAGEILPRKVEDGSEQESPAAERRVRALDASNSGSDDEPTGGYEMTGIVRGLFGLALAAVAVLAMVAPSAAQDATVEFTVWTAGAGAGAARGDGILTMADGKKYGISVENLKMGTVGLSYVQASGHVYNLKQAQDIEGNFLEGEAGIAVIYGVSGMMMKNEKDVSLKIFATQWGLNFTLGFGGMYIRVKSQFMK